MTSSPIWAWDNLTTSCTPGDKVPEAACAWAAVAPLKQSHPMTKTASTINIFNFRSDNSFFFITRSYWKETIHSCSKIPEGGTIWPTFQCTIRHNLQNLAENLLSSNHRCQAPLPFALDTNHSPFIQQPNGSHLGRRAGSTARNCERRWFFRLHLKISSPARDEDRQFES